MTAPEPPRLVTGAEALSDDALLAYYPARDRPWLRANAVTSVDGAVEVDGRSGGLSGPTDRRLLRLLRSQCDALLVGAGTIRAEGYAPPLVDGPYRDRRRAQGLPEHPTLVVVSGTLALDPATPALAKAAVRPVVLTGAAAPAGRRAALAEVADLVIAGDAEVDLVAGLARLRERGLSRILCEGGPRLLGGLVAAGRLDELCLTVSPLLAGAGAGRIVAGPATARHRLALCHVLAAADGLFLRYRRAGPGAGTASR